MAVQQPVRTYPVFVGGWLGAGIAFLVLVLCIIFWAIGTLDPKLALLIGGVAVARLV